MPLPYTRAPRRAAVPISALPTPEDEEDISPQQAALPSAQRPSATGTTGGIVPRGAGTFDAPAPGRLSDDRATREQQSIDRAQADFAAKQQQENPFLFSNDIKQLSTVGGRRYDEAAIVRGEGQYRDQLSQDRAALVAQRRQQILDRNAANSKTMADFEARGVQHYIDPASKLVTPIVDDQGRTLFHATDWEEDVHPKTGAPTLTKRDKYGQRQFKDLPVVPGLDPTDDTMYFKSRDGSLTPAGKIADMAASPNYMVARTALAANKRRVEAVHRQGLAPLKEDLDTALGASQAANTTHAEMVTRLKDAQTEMANNPDQDSEEYKKAADTVEVLTNKLPARVMENRKLSETAARAKQQYDTARKRMVRDIYQSQIGERQAILRREGGDPSQDKILQFNQGMLDTLNQHLGEQAPPVAPTPQAAAAAQSPTPPASLPPSLKEAWANAGPLERLKIMMSPQRGDTEVQGAVPMIGSEAAGTKGGLFTIPKAEGMGTGAGVINAANKFTAGLTTPENVALMAATGGASTVARAGAGTALGTAAKATEAAALGGFAAQGAVGTVDAVKEARRVLADPKSTKAERADAVSSIVLNAGMAAAAAHGAVGAAKGIRGTPPADIPSPKAPAPDNPLSPEEAALVNSHLNAPADAPAVVADMEANSRGAVRADLSVPPAPKSAEEAAGVFEPALAERANTPPPATSAADSAQVFAQDAQATRNAGVSEEGAQALVDQLQQTTGQPREAILATRNNPDGTPKPIEQWADELQSESEYQASPHTVDPERRAGELRQELAQHDADWQRHTDQVAAEARQYEQMGDRPDEAAAMVQAARDRHDRLTARREAIETQLTEADRLRQSPEGGAKLAEQLGEQAAPTADVPKETAPAENAAAPDRAEYDRLTAQLHGMVEKAGTPEYNEVQQRIEDIKNRNKGMPPGGVAGGEISNERPELTPEVRNEAISKDTGGASPKAKIQGDRGGNAGGVPEAPARSAEQRLNDAGADLPPISSMSREAKRAELDAAGIKTYKGKPLDEANPAEISNAVGKLRRGELTPEGEKPGKLDSAISRLDAEIKKYSGDGKGGKMDPRSERGSSDLHTAAYMSALRIARAVLAAGRSVAEAVSLAIRRYKAVHPEHTAADLQRAEDDLNSVLSPPPSAPKTATPQPTKRGPAPGETTGIAHRVNESAGMAADRGEGISAKASTEQGREKYAPEKAEDAIKQFEADPQKRVSEEAFQLAKAHKEALAKVTNAAADASGLDSPEYKAAREAEEKWVERIKPLQTEWHRQGQAQQGETEIDTGTFHGLARAYRDATGKDFTEKQSADAKRISTAVKDKTTEATEAQDKLLKAVDDGTKPTKDTVAEAAKAVTTREPGTPWTPQDAKALWHLAKAQYLDKGITDINDIRAGLATDYGLSKEDIYNGLASPKGARVLTDEMYAKMAAQRRVTNLAKQWVAEAKYPGYEKFFRGIPNAFFNLATFGHGTVWTVTHAGNQYFLPKATGQLFKDLGRSFKLMGAHDNGAYHERMMQDLVRDPLFIKAKRAGLANDPFRYQDDYQNAGVVKLFKSIGLMGNRGFDGMKLFRQFRFNQEWESLPDSLKTPESAKLLADNLNKATGITKASNLPKWTNTAFFAPKLEASRWAFLYGDPIKDARVLLNKRNESPEAVHAAVRDVRQKLTMAGVYLGALGVNQALLSASGSDDKINFTNPRSGDWLSFKGFGHNVGVVGPMISSVRFLQNIAHDFWGERSKLEKIQSTRGSEAGTRAFEYLRGKLSPFAGVALDVASQSDAVGRPLPFSNDPLSYRAKNLGAKDKYSYQEYASKKLLPIPLEEAAQDIWRSQGRSEDTIDKWMRAIGIGIASGTTGARISPEAPPFKAKAHAP